MTEASPLAEKISKTLLECAICTDTFQDPRALPCHHGFCRECLEQLVQSSEDKQTLVCPTCRKTVKLSKEGVKVLPAHFILNSLQDTVDMETKSNKPSTDTCCSNCDKKKAVVRCLDCKEYLCDTCYASHNTLKVMKDHRIVSMSDILSGKVNLQKEEDQKCQIHGKKLEYYCKNEEKSVCQDCVILQECKAEHVRITPEKAAEIKSDDLKGLAKKCDVTLKKFKEAVKMTLDVESELEIHAQRAQESLEQAKEEHLQQVENIAKKHKAEIYRIKTERLKELGEKKTSLETVVRQMKKAKEDTTRVTESGSEYEILTNHATLSRQLQELSLSTPVAGDKSLAYVKFKAAIPVVPTIGQLLVGKDAAPKWVKSDLFNTGDFDQLQGLAINRHGDIAIASWYKGVKVYSRSGMVKCTLYTSPGAVDVAVTHDNKYVTVPVGEKCIKISQGKHLSTVPIKDVNNKPSNVNSLAIDTKGRIIVGQCNNTISIHHPDGSVISKFATQSKPFRIAITSNGEIVSSIFDPALKQGKSSVQLMNYSGGNIRVIQPPPDVKVWHPSCVCCKQGEIFVSNHVTGDPLGVYRYTSEGEYLGCVTTNVTNPSGIDLAENGKELIVADYGDSMVKIFQRQ